MRRTLHLHIGLPKCGSSSLQGFLFHNHAALLEAGFAYPLLVDKAIGNLTPFLKSFQAPQDKAVFLRNNPGYDPEKARADLHHVLKQNSAANMILSSEGIIRCAKKIDLDFILEGFDETVVHLFLRPQVSWLVSHYAQGVKTGKYRFEFADFLESSPFRELILPDLKFSEQVGFWNMKVGCGNVRLHFLAQDKPSPPAQFLDAIGVDLPLEQGRHAQINRSLSPFETCLLVSVEPQSQPGMSQVVRGVRALAAKYDCFQDCTLVTPQQVALIRSLFEQDTERFLSQQNVISRVDLTSEALADKKPVTFAEIRASAAFRQVSDLLAKKGIVIAH